MSEEKKIIVDEDWKSQVAAERESLQQATAETPAATGAGETAPPGDAAAQMPPASLEMLVSTLATEALVALGQLPHPATQRTAKNPAQARYAIDMLEMLQQKTKGNLDAAEERMFTDLLHQLRMLFVATPGAPGQ